MTPRFHDRSEAGRALAAKLTRWAGRDDVIVLALPRGGVPVAWEVARALDAPLDLCVVRKLGVPGHEELAMGAIGPGGVRVLHDEAVAALRIPPNAIDLATARESKELARRERLYRGDRPAPDLRGKVVLLVDDGLATGFTMRAAVQSTRAERPARVVVAVPVSAEDARADLSRVADEVVSVRSPAEFQAVGLWYSDFDQVEDAEVQRLLSLPGGTEPVLRAIAAALVPIQGEAQDYDALVELVGEARVVLLGEATHGTHEFYAERARITRRLVEERGFTMVAIEGDWPDARRVHRFVNGLPEDADAVDALGAFRRFPAWMWRNADVLDFVGWMRAHNDTLPAGAPKAGFFGLDLYSLHESVAAVLRYLDRTDPEAAGRAREAYACLGSDPQRYGLAAVRGLAPGCDEAVIRELVRLQRKRQQYLPVSGEEAFFSAEQNAKIVANAEEYYRSMFQGPVSTWNLRDTHMADTLDSLLERGGRAVVWAHNSHVGDARHTYMGAEGEVNLGQLCRQRHPGSVVTVGFTTAIGTVTAASEWGGGAERKRVRPPLAGSYEALFHKVAEPAWFLDLRGEPARGLLREERLERAIGVIYRPDTERRSHYFPCAMPDQFDAVIHLDETRAVEPLERMARLPEGDAPETWPTGV